MLCKICCWTNDPRAFHSHMHKTVDLWLAFMSDGGFAAQEFMAGAGEEGVLYIAMGTVATLGGSSGDLTGANQLSPHFIAPVSSE